MIKRKWNINGKIQNIQFEEDQRLLDVLRDVLDLTGTKEGCGEGECGTCSVIINGELKLACLQLAAVLPDGTDILTIEGVEKTSLGKRIQRSFIETNAVQCGFCTPGMIIASFYLLSNHKKPDRKTIKRALSGNLCRCTGYNSIFEAIELASGRK
ncbi:MAG: (2Fe-2S)-binding protein [Deltaproteobacteria bacterium]|nr:(2Fe-2S)-binding protein [Deltaproteobacteria bacterium]